MPHEGRATTERAALITDIGNSEIRLLALALPEQTSSLLDYDLTLQQLRLFAFVLASGRVRISAVADALGIKPNVATGIIQRLVGRGLVGREEDSVDRRVRLLTVTEQGFALIQELSEIVLAKQHGLLDRLSDQQLRQLRDILAAMEPEA